MCIRDSFLDEDELIAAHTDDVAVAQGRGAHNEAAVQHRAVAAAEVGEIVLAGVHALDHGVVARNLDVAGEHDGALFAAPDAADRQSVEAELPLLALHDGVEINLAHRCSDIMNALPRGRCMPLFPLSIRLTPKVEGPTPRLQNSQAGRRRGRRAIH